MKNVRYTASIGDSEIVAESVSYGGLLRRVTERIVNAAIARSADEGQFEDEQLRCRGLSALQIFRDGCAVWLDRESFVRERTIAQSGVEAERFASCNRLDPALYRRIDRDLRRRWRAGGYNVPSLLACMRRLFRELERDAASQAARARASLAQELVLGLFPEATRLRSRAAASKGEAAAAR